MPHDIFGLQTHSRAEQSRAKPSTSSMDLDGSRKLINVLIEFMPNSRIILKEEIEQEEERQSAVLNNGSDCACACKPTQCSKEAITPGVIVRFLTRTLGNCPEPPWGVPLGWASYLAQLMSVMLDRPVSLHQALECIHWSENGCCKTVPAKIKTMGLFPDRWKHPLILQDVQKSNAEGKACQSMIYTVTQAVSVLVLGLAMSWMRLA